MGGAQAVAFLRPTRENVTHLKKELAARRFASYHLVFTNLLNPMYLQARAAEEGCRAAAAA
jgi:hypothetical protein